MPSKTQKTKSASKPKTALYTHSVGRRKRAVARIRLATRKTKDDVTLIVNGKLAADYFRVPGLEAICTNPLKTTNTLDKFIATVKVLGSGPVSQAQAVSLGLARALVKVDETHKLALKKAGLMTRDPREKERRKIGTGGKARRRKQSPKR